MTRRALIGVVSLLLLPTAGAAQTVPHDFLVTMRRTSCFGTCPVYEVSIDAGGKVTYRGDQFVRVEGRMTANISRAEVAALAAQVDRIAFFSMKNHYDGAITDLPTTFVTVRRNGRTKRIEDYFGAPDSLREFEALIDTTAGTRRWTRIDRLTLERMFQEKRPPLPAQQRVMLQEALRYNDVDVIETLLAHGVDLSTATNEPPFLHMAGSADAAQALIAAGADVNEPWRGNGGPLHSAATQRADLTTTLIKAGARVDQPDTDTGATPLYKASCAGNAAVVKLLLAAGADATLRFGRGWTALDCARSGQQVTKEVESQFLSFGKSPYEDYAGTIAVLEAAVAKPQS